MRTIDGVRYISAKEYAEMKGFTVGRVSQLKLELPFVKFDEFGIELINFDLIELSETERTLAQTKFQTVTPIHELSYKDLGNYFGKLTMDLVNFKGGADIKIEDLQAKSNDLRQKLQVVENERAELSSYSLSLEVKAKSLAAEIAKTEEAYEELAVKFDQFSVINKELNLQHDVLSKDFQDLKIVHTEGKHELEIKIIENKNLSAENESLKSRLASLELAAKNDADFREEFKNFKELVMTKIG